MIVTVASFKGGVGKTTTAVHLAAFLQGLAPTVCFDGDPTKSATQWARRAMNNFAFKVAPSESMAMLSTKFEHKVIDTGQKPSGEDLQAAAEWSDLLVIPAVPSSLDTDGLIQTIQALQQLGCKNYKVLLTRVAPDAAGAAIELREALQSLGAPVFRAEIPRLKAFEKAAGEGMTVDQVSDRNAARGWAAYDEVGLEMMR